MLHLVLIDGNGLGFAGMSNPTLSTGDRDTQSTFTFVRRIRFLLTKYPEALIMVLWDGRSWRKDIVTDYKANREQTPQQIEARKAYYDQKKDIVACLNHLGIMQVSADNMEADDLAEIYSRKWKGDKITLITADKDWLQLVDERTTWYDMVNERACDHTNFVPFTGCENKKEFLLEKCVFGDVGDNIKGILGIGPKKLELLKEQGYDFEDFLLRKDDMGGVFPRNGKKLPKVLRELDVAQAHTTLRRNMMLMDLSTPHRPEPINLVNKRGKLDPEKLTDLFGELGFVSILRELDKFLIPFKENKYVAR
jgi:5'-3' exonuclease